MSRFDIAGHLYVLLTIVFTVYGQLVLKWQMKDVGPLPESGLQKLVFLFALVANPWILSGFAAAFLASLSWMAAMTRLEMSYAYPFMSLAFVIVVGAGSLVYGEALTIGKILGTLLVICGLIVMVRGQ
jgi:multidrug transporter EmrE-like cation transporter